jgi:hypothetical protein
MIGRTRLRARLGCAADDAGAVDDVAEVSLIVGDAVVDAVSDPVCDAVVEAVVSGAVVVDELLLVAGEAVVFVSGAAVVVPGVREDEAVVVIGGRLLLVDEFVAVIDPGGVVVVTGAGTGGGTAFAVSCAVVVSCFSAVSYRALSCFGGVASAIFAGSCRGRCFGAAFAVVVFFS